MTASVLDVKLSQQQMLSGTANTCDRDLKHSEDAEKVESRCSPAYQLKLEQILCVQKSEFRSSSIHPTFRIHVNHSHRLLG